MVGSRRRHWSDLSELAVIADRRIGLLIVETVLPKVLVAGRALGRVAGLTMVLL